MDWKVTPSKRETVHTAPAQLRDASAPGGAFQPPFPLLVKTSCWPSAPRTVAVWPSLEIFTPASKIEDHPGPKVPPVVSAELYCRSKLNGSPTAATLRSERLNCRDPVAVLTSSTTEVGLRPSVLSPKD